MTEFVSDIKTIPQNEETVFRFLSDFSNLEQFRDIIPQHESKIKDFVFDNDSCSFTVDPVGKVKFSIIEREPSKTIKLKADELPVEIYMWIQLKQVAEMDTKMKLTIKANLSPFLKPMVSKPLQEGINKIAEILANIPYQ